MKYLAIWITLALMASCRNTPQSGNLTAANLEALEQTVDMESHKVEQDGVLQFEQAVIELGDVPLGESREVSLAATNQSDKPLVLLEAYTSCQCTKVVWDKRPIPPGGKTGFIIHFTADQIGTFFKKIAVRHSADAAPVTFAVQGIVVNSSKENR